MTSHESGSGADPTDDVATMTDRDKLLVNIEEHLLALSDDELRAEAFRLEAIARGRRRLGLVDAESDRDLDDAIEYLRLQRSTRHP